MKTYRKIPDWPEIRRRYSDFWMKNWPEDRLLMQVQNLAREVSPDPRWMKDVSFQEKKYRDPALFFQLID
ncbi:MAG TPA: hypothetical protein PK644_09215, partial [bacterium]|nr:hypothetical protein [bacterium]